MDYQSFFHKNGVECQAGLKREEFLAIEDAYKIVFPMEYKRLLEQVLPISQGFYNWRDFSPSNYSHIKMLIKEPIEQFWKNAVEVYWNTDWGNEPKDSDELVDIVRHKLVFAPKLIPVFSHRYIPMCGGNNNPVFSVCGTDVVYYGSNIDEYLEIEFKKKKQQSIDFSKVKKIPFWSEVI